MVSHRQNYNPNLNTWSFVRSEIAFRDLFTCQMCGRNISCETYHCDHLIPLNKFGSMWDYNNLITLCVECHKLKTKQERLIRKTLANREFKYLHKIGENPCFCRLCGHFYICKNTPFCEYCSAIYIEKENKDIEVIDKPKLFLYLLKQKERFIKQKQTKQRLDRRDIMAENKEKAKHKEIFCYLLSKITLEDIKKIKPQDYDFPEVVEEEIKKELKYRGVED